MKDRKISVIIPVYNVEKYLERCLFSITNNTYRNLEIICVNDGSSDHSLDILNRYKLKDQRILVIDKENGGVSSARNAGLDIASGDYIAFIDSDDWISLEYFSLLMKALDDTSADMVYCRFKKTGQTSDTVGENHECVSPKMVTVEQYFSDHLSKYYVCGKIYKSSIVGQLRFEETLRVFEDFLFNIQVFTAKDTLCVACLDAQIYYYFNRPESAVHSFDFDERVKACEYMIRSMKKNLFDNDRLCRILSEEVIKKLLQIRYAAYLTKDVQLYKRCNNGMRGALDVLKKQSRLATIKDLTVYYAFYKMPCFYRIFRIVTDPTMIDWEKSVREDTGKSI